MGRRENRAQRIQDAVEELQTLIRSRFPEAEFVVTRRRFPDPGTYLEVYANPDDPVEITELISERRADLELEVHESLFVWPLPYDRRPSLKAQKSA